jgi:surface polysaccharide O-acyltransferase-like enzyme
MKYDFITDNHWKPYLNYLVISLFSTCVPIFFFVNGGLLLNKSSFDLKKHISKTIQIILLTLIWGVITMIALSFILKEPIGVRRIIRGVLELRQQWVNHLWFMEALVVIYFFFPLIYLAYHKQKEIFHFFFVVVCIFSFGNYFIGMGGIVLSSITGKFQNTYFLINHFSEFNPFRGIYGFPLGYFLLGGVIFNYRDWISEKVKKSWAWFVLLASTLLLGSFGILLSFRMGEIWDVVFEGYESIFTLVNVLALFVISLHYKPRGWLGKGIQQVSENTLGIYFIHVILGYLLSPYFEMIPSHNTFILTMLFGLILLLISLITVLTLKSVPIVKRLFSIG